MRKPYSKRQRILGFSCAILLLITLAACGKAAEMRTSKTAPGTISGTEAVSEPASTPVPGADATEAPGTEAGLSSEHSEKADSSADLIRDKYTALEEVHPEAPAYDASLSSRADASTPAAPMDGGAEDEPMPGDGDLPVEPIASEPIDAAPFVLTAGEWNDNANWPFFVNLVRSGAISFPAFGIDPTNRIQVTVQDEAGTPLANETVTLYNAEGENLWTAQTGKTGVAYLFFQAGQTPDRVAAAGAESTLTVTVPDENGQGTSTVQQTDEIVLVGTATAQPRSNLQIMFIVDTTGSMSDELVYLQKDFSSIAEEVGNTGVSYSACFYRDEGDDYVTRCNGFTSDVAAVQALINAEYADGGGDTPEAVAQILNETLADSTGWAEDSVKIAFLIFDAPPHEGTDAALDRAVRAAAERGIHVIPVVASNADRETELFGRALAICTDGTYVFLTDDSGVGDSHLEPIIGNYEVEKLHDVIVRIIESYRVN